MDNLLRQLDRKSQQVEIEARVVAANRSFAREIGTAIRLAFGTSNGNNVVGGDSTVGTSRRLTFTAGAADYRGHRRSDGDLRARFLWSPIWCIGSDQRIPVRVLIANFALDFDHRRGGDRAASASCFRSRK